MLFHYTFQQPSQKQNIRKQVYMDRKKVAFICIKEHKTCHVTLIILDKSKNIKPSRTEMCKNVFADTANADVQLIWKYGISFTRKASVRFSGLRSGAGSTLLELPAV